MKVKKQKSGQLIVFAVLAFVGIAGLILIQARGRLVKSRDNSGKDRQFVSVDPDRFNEIAKDAKAFLLDVHIPEQTHIPGTDAFVPYNEIKQNLDKLPSDKKTPLLIYCRSGAMSKQAAAELAALGFSQVYELEGGINNYKESNVRVEMHPESRDLETVVYGDIAKTEFTLTNFSPVALTLTRVSTSCGCTSAKAQKEKLNPYESTKITVSFNPAVHGDDTDLGNVTRTIYIDTDNPNFSQITAQITAYVIKKAGE